MGINISQFRDFIIRPYLKRGGLWSLNAEHLLIGTLLQESNGGEYIHQVGGPALGMFQIEAATYKDVIKNYLSYRPDKTNLFLSILNRADWPQPTALIGDLALSTVVARLIYFRVPHKLPLYTNPGEVAKYWKLFYNTPEGKGTEQQFINKYIPYLKEISSGR